ncbi:hypothetical protein DRJ48_02295 [Candidatus Woesearchaeota archaeon]|nr:MAG: hypothetical protein DRJ48_02295 [Candidatus Woesearchaeota archaeon]
MEFVDKHTIRVEKELNSLDRLVIDFCNVLSNFTTYVIVSGYVAILFGRSRMSEDIDIIIDPINDTTIKRLNSELQKHGFYSINADKIKTICSLLNESYSVRFARKATIIPNIELKFAKNPFEELALRERLKVMLPYANIFVSPIELQIAFKRVVLGSDKDKEDALHLEIVFQDLIDRKLLKQLENELERDY